MINRVLEKVIPFLVKWYTNRKKAPVFGDYSLSYEDKDFLYAWVSHSKAQTVYKAMEEAIQRSYME